jgi:hypothetical protein
VRAKLAKHSEAQIAGQTRAQKVASEAQATNSSVLRSKKYRKTESKADTIVYDKVFARWPQDDDELHLFVEAVWGYRIPRTRVCPNHQAPFEAFADAYFARTPVSIWEASRGFGGKSAMLAVLVLTEALTLACGITILGGSGAQSQNVHRATDQAWAHPNAPRKALRNSTMFDTSLHNGAWIRSLTASETSVRGPHPQRLRLDEIDEMKQSILESAQGQPMMDKRVPGVQTQTVMSSTHQHPDGTMTAMLKRAKEMEWGVFCWCMVSGTMVTTDRGQVPIERIETGDRVLTRSGWRSVQHRTWMGRKPTVRVVLADGKEIGCTPDHRVAIADGAKNTNVRLWESDGSTGETVRRLPSANDWQHAEALVPRTQSRSGRQEKEVPTLRGAAQESSVVILQAMLHYGRTSIEEHSTETHNGAGTFSGLQSGTERQRDETGTGRGGTTDSPGLWVPTGSGDWNLQRGLPVGRWADRGSVRLASRQTEQESRQETDRLVETSGSRSDRVVASFASSVVESVLDGPVADVWDVGVEGEHEFVANGIVVHNCYKESSNPNDGWLSAEEIARKRKEVTAAMWRTEYDLQEPSFAGRAIDTAAVDAQFDPHLGQFEGEEHQVCTLEMPGRYDNNRMAPYVTAVDWAKEQDYTVVATFRTDTYPWVCVRWKRFRRVPWPAMVNRAQVQWREYGGKFIHDATGLGDVIDDYLTVTDSERRQKIVIGQTLGGATRTAMFNEYIAAIESQHILYPRIEFAYDEHRYVTEDDLFGKGHAPDSFVAGALAWSLHPPLLQRVATANIAPVLVGSRRSGWLGA